MEKLYHAHSPILYRSRSRKAGSICSKLNLYPALINLPGITCCPSRTRVLISPSNNRRKKPGMGNQLGRCSYFTNYFSQFIIGDWIWGSQVENSFEFLFNDVDDRVHFIFQVDPRKPLPARTQSSTEKYSIGEENQWECSFLQIQDNTSADDCPLQPDNSISFEDPSHCLAIPESKSFPKGEFSSIFKVSEIP